MSEIYKEKLNGFYSKYSDIYDSTYTGEGRYKSNYFRTRIALQLIKELKKKDFRILDAGCGNSRVLTELVINGFSCRGFDYNKEMLVQSYKRLKENNLDKCLVKQGDIYQIPFEKDSFEIILCLGVLPNLPNHKSIFKEFKRVLSPEGRIIISLNNQLFSLFSMNNYTVEFFKDIFESINIQKDIKDNVISEINNSLLCKNSDSSTLMSDQEIDTQKVKLEQYNPLNVHERLKEYGFYVEKIRFYHYHPLPPCYESKYPDLFRLKGEGLETTEYDWKGALLCNAMVIQAKLMD